VDEEKAGGGKPAKTATAGKGKTPKKKSPPWEPIKVFLEVPKSGKAAIILLGDGKVRLVDFRQLQSRLGAMRKKGLDANNPVVILYKGDMPDEWITKAFDAAIAAGFANVRLKSQP
jgi:biopolymer transport protein ExbD